ncbi:GAF domain-containing protein [Lagierella sp.]|uniref:GAF domain-containing protein n=1 Tax=Lagierella sp. TaxID=2849657 RepID=UPI00261E774C|nr:GAF domain-containing protein [Lagierella sp.]
MKTYDDILSSFLDELMKYKTVNEKLQRVSELIYDNMENVIWAGFYLMDRDGVLILGPYKGEPACIRIPVGDGVCGTSALLMETKKVYDVSMFPGHITCDESAKSELVVPLIKNDVCYGVIDIDSDIINNFTEEDQDFVEQIRNLLVNSIDFNAEVLDK